MVHDDDLVGEAFGLEQQVGAHHDGLAVLGHLVDEAEHGARPTPGRGRPSARRGAGGPGRARRPGRARAGPACRSSTRRPAGRGRRRSRSGRPRDAGSGRRRRRTSEQLGRVPQVRRTRRGGRTARVGPARRRTDAGSDWPSGPAGSRPNTRTVPTSGLTTPVTTRTDGRLARAVRTEQDGHLARPDPQREVVERDDGAERAVYARRARSQGRPRAPRIVVISDTPDRLEPAGNLAAPGGVAEWFRQGPAKPRTRVRFPPPPPTITSPHSGCLHTSGGCPVVTRGLLHVRRLRYRIPGGRGVVALVGESQSRPRVRWGLGPYVLNRSTG